MPTDEQRAFWSAIRANPLDDTPRLVYADWLQEHGDEARAEFIRLQIEQAAMFSPSALCSDPNERRLSKRESKLIERHKNEWLRPVFEAVEPVVQRFNWAYTQRQIKFTRGFARDIPLPLEAVSLLAAHDAEIEPMENVSINRGAFESESSTALMREVASWPNADCIRGIDVHDATDEFVNAMVSGCLNSVQQICFREGMVSDTGAICLAAWPQAASLRVLDLMRNDITDAGIVALVASPHLDNLQKLLLDGNRFTATGWSGLRERFRNRLVSWSEP